MLKVFNWFTSSLVVSTFKHDDVSMLKTFMCGHSCVMTFLHLKVHNGLCKFSVGSVFKIFCWFSFLHHLILGLVSTFKVAMLKTFMRGDPSVVHLCVVLHFLILGIYSLNGRKFEARDRFTAL